MNKFTKGCLLVTAFLLVVGLLVGGIGFALGGMKMVRDMAWAGDFSWGHNGYFPYIVGNNDSWDWENEGFSYAKSFEDDEVAEKDEIDSLDIEMGKGALYIHESDSDFFQVKVNNGYFRYEVKDATLVIEAFKGRVDHNSTVDLYIPAGKTFREADLKVGAALMEANELRADEISLQVGAGEATINKAEAERLDLDIAVGTLVINAAVSGDIEADCGVGTLEMYLDGREEDFNYSIGGGLSNISVGMRSISGMGVDDYINNEADKVMNLKCGLGNLSVEFQD